MSKSKTIDTRKVSRTPINTTSEAFQIGTALAQADDNHLHSVAKAVEDTAPLFGRYKNVPSKVWIPIFRDIGYAKMLWADPHLELFEGDAVTAIGRKHASRIRKGLIEGEYVETFTPEKKSETKEAIKKAKARKAEAKAVEALMQKVEKLADAERVSIKHAALQLEEGSKDPAVAKRYAKVPKAITKRDAEAIKDARSEITDWLKSKPSLKDLLVVLEIINK